MPTDPEDRVYEALIEAMRHLRVEYTEGRGSSNAPLPDESCPYCDARGSLRYLGSDVLEGSLEMFHLVHTEVDHHLGCGACGRSFTVFKML